MGKKVGKLIKAARTDADLTQEQLARRITGLSDRDISLAERGEKDLTQAQLKKIATITGVTQASLLNAAKEEKGTEPKKSTTAKKSSTSKKTATTKAKTPANANSTMKVTSTERKLVEAYRLADSEARKRALDILQGEDAPGLNLGSLLGETGISGTVSDVIEGVMEDLFGK